MDTDMPIPYPVVTPTKFRYDFHFTSAGVWRYASSSNSQTAVTKSMATTVEKQGEQWRIVDVKRNEIVKQSKPKNYVFTGNKGDQTKQVGNGIPVRLSKAHTYMALQGILEQTKQRKRQ